MPAYQLPQPRPISALCALCGTGSAAFLVFDTATHEWVCEDGCKRAHEPASTLTLRSGREPSFVLSPEQAHDGALSRRRRIIF